MNRRAIAAVTAALFAGGPAWGQGATSADVTRMMDQTRAIAYASVVAHECGAVGPGLAGGVHLAFERELEPVGATQRAVLDHVYMAGVSAALDDISRSKAATCRRLAPRDVARLRGIGEGALSFFQPR